MDEKAVKTEDRHLASQVLESGSEKAFRVLYSRHTGPLYRFTLRILNGSEADAEEVVQETWIRAIDKLDGFEWRSSLRSWLTGIALNLCRRRLRAGGTRELQLDIDPPSPAPDHGLSLDLEASLALLPEGYRTVLVLHDVEGFKHHEIAGMLQISAGTSKSQLSRARRMMRDLLSSHQTEQEVST